VRLRAVLVRQPEDVCVNGVPVREPQAPVAAGISQGHLFRRRPDPVTVLVERDDFVVRQALNLDLIGPDKIWALVVPSEVVCGWVFGWSPLFSLDASTPRSATMGGA
jgi:hypothetical protein